MDPALFALSRASLTLALLRADLIQLAGNPLTTEDVRNAIAMGLPVLDQDQRDLDRRINVFVGAGTFPKPTDAALADLRAATESLANAIAHDQQTASLFNLAVALASAAKKVG